MICENILEKVTEILSTIHGPVEESVVVFKLQTVVTFIQSLSFCLIRYTFSLIFYMPLKTFFNFSKSNIQYLQYLRGSLHEPCSCNRIQHWKHKLRIQSLKKVKNKKLQVSSQKGEIEPRSFLRNCLFKRY